MESGEYINGYIERRKDGSLEGILRIDGVDISPIEGKMFKKDGDTYLWLRRKDLTEYDVEEQRFKTRKRKPRWETYIKKQLDKGTVAFKGEFFFLRYRYSITGVWDNVFGIEKGRLNLFVDRFPMREQTLLNKIREKNEDD